MTRVLFTTSPVWGHISPTIAVAQRLQSLGHDVAYACHPEMAPAIERAGLHVLKDFHWGDLILNVQRDIATQPNRWLALLRGTRGSPTRLYFHGLDRGVQDLITVLRSWKADVVVTDLLFHPGAIAAEACKSPYATFCPVILPLPSAALPPYGFGLSPRTRADWRWILGRIVLRRLERSGDRTVNRVRHRYGLAHIRGVFFYPSPYLFLVFTTESFEYPRPDLPRQVFYVGPSISERRGDTDVPFPWEWLDGRPLVYASLGTINTGHVRFFDTAIEATQGQPWQIVISIGRYLDPGRWTGLPENVLLRNYVPQPELLRRARAVITHGGVNTVTEALAARLPLGVVPVGADQFESAQRVVEAGAGFRLRMRKVSVANLRATIRSLLDDPSLRKNAERVAEDYAKCDGPGTSAALILRMAEKRAPLLRPPNQRPTIYANEVEKFL